jgi:hypothetical protein
MSPLMEMIPCCPGIFRTVTPHFLQRNKTLEINYLNKQLCWMHSCRCIIYLGLVCALVFYFTNRNHSIINIDLNSYKFAIFENEKDYTIFSWALG